MGKAKPADGGSPHQANAANGPWLTAAFVVLAVCYLAWFFQQSAGRLALLGQLRDPFSFVAQWFGPAGTPLGLLDRLPVLAMALVILLAAYGCGRLAIDFGKLVNDVTQLERSVLALAAGLSLLSTAMLLAGLAGVLSQRWLLWVVVIALAVAGVWRVVGDQSRVERDQWSRLCRTRSALFWVAVAFSIMTLLGACLPPWDFDVREYHLQVPKEWLQQGQITFLPNNVYGNMPLGAEMHALLAMALWPGESGWFYGALAGKVVMAAYAIITALGLAAAGERLAGKWAGRLAACIYLAHPWVMHVSIGGLNDGALACYVFLAAYAMWLARRGAGSFLLPGLLAGAAAACKYPGLAFAVAPLAVWCCVGRIFNPSRISHIAADGLQIRPTVALALFLFGAVAGGGAWYAKNAALAHNPVYPLAYYLFGGQTRTPDKHAQWQRAHQVPPDEQGRQFSPSQAAGSLARIAGRDDLASPLMVPLLIVAAVILVRNPQSTLPFALLLALVLTVWWLLSHRLDRFLLPAWPLAALLAAAGAAAFEGVWSRRAVLAFCGIGLAYCFLAGSSKLVGDNRWFVSLAQLRRDQPWPEGTPLRVKREHKFLNETVEPGQAVLLVGEAAVFDLNMPALYSTCFDNCLLCDFVLGKTADQRREELARRGIAWVVVDWPEIRRYQSPGNYGFDPRFQAELLDELVAQEVLDPPQRLQADSPGRPIELYPVQGSRAKQPSAAGVP